jgi:hypothetical protein
MVEEFLAFISQENELTGILVLYSSVSVQSVLLSLNFFFFEQGFPRLRLRRCL